MRQAAAVATHVVSIVGGILIAGEILPNHHLISGFGYLTFAVVLSCWQHIRDVVMHPRLMFMDKLCIPQEDEHEKERHILGLAGYLRSSRKLVVLWSEFYCTRLWCMYECASYLRTNPDAGCVQVMPVAVPLLILLHCTWWAACRAITTMLWTAPALASWDIPLRATLGFLAVCTALMLTFPLQARVGAQLVQSLGQLVCQLRNFSIHKAECSCCSQQHQHPQTKAAIPCDRELVYQTLAEWHGEPGQSLDSRLDMFSESIRKDLANRILKDWGNGALPLRPFVCAVFSMNAPILFGVIPNIAEVLSRDAGAIETLASTLAYLLGWASWFPSMLIYLWFCTRICARRPNRSCPVTFDVASMLLISVVVLLVLGLQGLPLSLLGRGDSKAFRC